MGLGSLPAARRVALDATRHPGLADSAKRARGQTVSGVCTTLISTPTAVAPVSRHRLRVAIVEADRDAHVALVRAAIHERIEPDPAGFPSTYASAHAWPAGCCVSPAACDCAPCAGCGIPCDCDCDCAACDAPSTCCMPSPLCSASASSSLDVARVLLRVGDALHRAVRQHVARDVARGNLQHARGRDERMRMVAARALAALQRGFRVDGGVGGQVRRIRDTVVHFRHQPVQRVEAVRRDRQRLRQRAHGVARLRQRRFALEDPRRRIAFRMTEDARAVLRLDDAGRDDDDLGLRAAVVPHEVDPVAGSSA